jgi:hypothetical protein
VAFAIGLIVGYALGYNLGKRPEWVKTKLEAIVNKVKEKQ